MPHTHLVHPAFTSDALDDLERLLYPQNFADCRRPAHSRRYTDEQDDPGELLLTDEEIDELASDGYEQVRDPEPYFTFRGGR